jgi:CheY-like chemotaxis protein
MPNRTILVADDEPHIVQVVALKLRNAGYEVLTAGDGEEALELAHRHRVDLVVTDQMMPYLTGTELARKLHESARTRGIPVLLLTARGYAIAPEDRSTANLRGVLAKPFSPRVLLSEIERELAAAPAREAA